MIYNISVVLIIVILLLLIKSVSMYLKNNVMETFKENSNIDKIGDVMNQIPKKLQYKKILDNIDDSIDSIREQSGQRLKNTIIDEELLNGYLHNTMKDDDSNNPLFQSSNINDIRPKISSADINDINSYNHKMRLLINSKKILQEYLINKFTVDIDNLLNSVTNVETLREKLNNLK